MDLQDLQEPISLYQLKLQVCDHCNGLAKFAKLAHANFLVRCILQHLNEVVERISEVRPFLK